MERTEAHEDRREKPKIPKPKWETTKPKPQKKMGKREQERRGKKKISTYHLSDLPGPAVFFTQKLFTATCFRERIDRVEDSDSEANQT